MWTLQTRPTRCFHHRDHRNTSIPSRHQESQRPPGGTSRRVQVVRRVLDTNDIMADHNREHFKAHDVFVLNMMSSPGSGKTTTLQRTLEELMPDIRCGVIVGDICTTHDADLLAASGAPVHRLSPRPVCSCWRLPPRRAPAPAPSRSQGSRPLPRRPGRR